MERNKEKKKLFLPIKGTRISDEVYNQIVSLISSGKFRPGDRLPSERDMASELGVSRQTIREALYRAEIMGLIEIRQGGGTFIRSSVYKPLEPPLTVLIEKEAERIFEFLEMRKLIEGWCAEKAAVEANADDLRHMSNVLERMKCIALKDKRWEEMDVALHFAIAEASHNIIAIHIMEALKVSFAGFFRFRNSIKSSENMELLWQHHHDIYEAIRLKEPVLARQKVIDHLSFIEERIKVDMGKIND